MKKTAIVSCYFQKNYGSVLQAYATQKALDVLKIENETIDISGFRDEIRKEKLKYFAKASLTSDILFHKAGMVKNVMIKKFIGSTYTAQARLREEQFERFTESNFRFSRSFPSKEELGCWCGEHYESVLVGSDQLWLPANIAADYYTLNFVPDSVNTVAYGTSFGQAVLPGDSAKKAALFLKRIRHLSVREETGQKLIKELTGRKVPVVCDPTILFDGNEWREIQKQEPLIEGDYIFCCFLGSNSRHREFAVNLKKKTGLKLVSLLHLDAFVKKDEKYADETPYDVGPGDYLNLIRNAAYVCTDSFHCTVFSLLYARPFYTFCRYASRSRQSTNSRLHTLLRMAGAEKRLLTDDADVQESLKLETDFAEVHKKLSAVRKSAWRYLECALRDRENTDL